MRLMLKTSSAARAFRLGAGGPRPQVQLRPLMPNLAAAATPALAAAGAAPTWQVSEEIDERFNPWDLCHALVRQGLGMGEGGVEFAEPDLEQSWVAPPAENSAFGGARAADCAAREPQSGDYPPGPADGWFATDAFSGLASARARIKGAPSVRLAHLDTGYDPGHSTRPARLLEAAGLNFADPDEAGAPTKGAADKKTAAINPMFGHGTATLALLAGEAYGGAKGFEVLPLRVANWVVLFRNSAIAAALDHILGLAGDPATRCDVVSMSMGGLASAAWADAVNALYDKGVVLVTAAGNNFGNLPVRSIVYPARFNRVLAACGVMADGTPYADLDIRRMAGCYGPPTKMRSALAAWTPNVPWAQFGCPNRVDQDGGGTSSATPQIAAAAALWLHQHRAVLAGVNGWQRVEAVRDALFRAAGQPVGAPDPRLGRGLLRADAALGLAPALAGLRQEKEDSTEFAVLRLLLGLGVAPEAPRRMLELEGLQLSQRSAAVAAAQEAFDAADEGARSLAGRRLLEALSDDPLTSKQLRQHIRQGLGRLQVVGARVAQPIPHPPVPKPPRRRLNVFAFDPGYASRMATRAVASTKVAVEWEPGLKPGPVGEFVEVVDVDPASDRVYAPIDLNQPEVLAQDGLPPSEGSPQFHQQMVYAVAMRTIGHFRAALGRQPLWASRIVDVPKPGAPGKTRPEHRFVRRLRIYPHALRQANAYYSPELKALLFGYFRAQEPGAVEVLQGGMVFTCLSHDVVAHETTHALLDGLHPYWHDFTNPDVPAFHEAFADLVALFQHFTMPDALLSAIRQARGKGVALGRALGQLAKQFGQAVGGHGALRNALGREGEVTDYSPAKEAHALGEVLVAAVFDAWRAVYQDRTADLVRLATNGTGVLPLGDIPYDLARRLAEEAAKLAGHFLNICIRALDYCPPVDPTFGEYLRAMITADQDLVRDDPRGYRTALVEGFRRRGIRPPDVLTWSPEAMVWEGPPADVKNSGLNAALAGMADHWQVDGDRLVAWRACRRDAVRLHDFLCKPGQAALRAALGLLEPRRELVVGKMHGTSGGIEVHSVRPLRRVGPDGQVVSDLVIVLTQSWTPQGAAEGVRGGCTLIWDRTMQEVRYAIYKRVGHRRRTAEQFDYRMAMAASGNDYGARGNGREPFAMLHTPH